ncbi:hypothetical protein NXS08_02160 [Gleimia sp. 6138-11-ORH1]|uniref:tetratricopeptide repeat protein n=1 Tax=Gleimia sp. 6138-11-ORH1 TaxID=2973937 RepID=UPI00216789C2|nr:tetratricopeptide repeat protein [Gleimia sp. 6138-11-ORH1]MCS4484295.1 hypothetical protein [Gleimia sp. 6138-11-ORH1]
MTSREELHQLMDEAANTPPGKTHNDLWAKAAELAEAGGFEEEAVISYVHLVNGYATGGQATKVIAPFIWCDQKIKERPDLFGGEIGFSHAWHYKYVIGAVRAVPSVPVEQCESLLEEMRKHYTQLGDGLRAYYIRKFLFARDWGTKAEAEEAFNQWRTANDSELSDCPSCDPSYEVAYYSRQGNWAKAVEIGEAALARQNENTCDSQPEALLTEMMEPWSRVGNDTSAWSAHTRAYRRYQEGARYLEDIPAHLHFLFLSGMAGRPQRLERGLRILLRHLPWWPEANTPIVLLNLAVEGALLFSTLLDNPSQKLNLTLPGEDLVWYPCETLHNPTVQEAYDWMRKLALGIASQFDERPGLKFKRYVEAIERRLEPTLLEIKAPEVDVLDVSGLYTPDESNYQVKAEKPAETVEGQSFAVPNREESVETKSIEYTPITLDTSWQNLSISQLFQAVVTGFGTFSSAYTYLYHRLFDPAAELPSHQELTIFATNEEEAATISEFWDTIVENRYTPWKFPGEFCAIPDPQSPEVKVIPHLVEASKAIKAHDFSVAVAAAKAAMQVPDISDALGIRLYGLDTLGFAYASLDKYEEAIQAYRQALNLYAALGVASQQALMGWKLSYVLISARRNDEAIEVLQSSVDVGANILPAELEARLRTELAEQYTKAKLLHSALRELLKAYQLHTNADEKFEVAKKIVDTAVNEGEFQIATEYQFKILEDRKTRVVYPLNHQTKLSHRDYAAEIFNAARRLVERPGIISESEAAQARELLETGIKIFAQLSELEGSDPERDVAELIIEYHRVIGACYSTSETEQKLQQALDIMKDHQVMHAVGMGLLALSLIAEKAGDYEKANETLNELLSLEGKHREIEANIFGYAHYLKEILNSDN